MPKARTKPRARIRAVEGCTKPQYLRQRAYLTIAAGCRRDPRVAPFDADGMRECTGCSLARRCRT